MAIDKYLSKVTLPNRTVLTIKDEEARNSIIDGNRRTSILENRLEGIIESEGWTSTSDIELHDIRVKIDGSIAQTAGSAVRQQILELKDSIYNNCVTPEDFGAYCDGVHDDSSAFASALMSGKPVVLTQDIHIFSCFSITNYDVYLDGRGHTVFIHGENMPENPRNGGRGGYAISIGVSIIRGEDENADVISYTENSTLPVDPAFAQSYRRGYISYHGHNPTPDGETYDDYTAYSWYEHRASIFNTKFICDNIDGIKTLRLFRLCNSIVENCDFVCTTEDGGAIGLMASFVYNCIISNVRASGFTCKNTRHINNVGYGVQVVGDCIIVQNCLFSNCKDSFNVGGGSGVGGIFTTGVIVDNLVLQEHDTGEMVEISPGRTSRLYGNMFDLHPGCIKPIINNIILEYENVNGGDSWGILATMSCPEAIISNMFCKFGKPDGSYGRGFFGFNTIAKRYDFYNVHAPGCYLFPTGWGYERKKQFDANYITEIKFVGGEIGGIINRAKDSDGTLTGKGLFKIRMYGTKITGLVDCPYLYANSCTIKNENIPSRKPTVQIRQGGTLTNCEIYSYSYSRKYTKSLPVISAPENSLLISNCIIRKPLDEKLLDNEQNMENNVILDLYGFVLGSRVTESYILGDECILDEYNLF